MKPASAESASTTAKSAATEPAGDTIMKGNKGHQQDNRGYEGAAVHDSIPMQVCGLGE
jgi:hypothetical protein